MATPSPPDPRYSRLEAFRQPKERPDEWGVHAALAETMETIAVPAESSPFVIDDVVARLLEKAQDYHINNLKTAEEALADLEREMAAEIRRSLDEDPDLLPLYEVRLATQAKIDDLRARGEKVPLSWISNPQHRRWYVFNGWADEEK